MENAPTTHNECCPLFNPEKWDGKTHTWENKCFIKETIPTFLHMPWPPMIGKRIGHMCKQAEAVDAMTEDMTETLVLFHDPSAFRSEIFMSVTQHVPEAENVTLSGTFVSKVFDGPYKDAPKFMKEMDAYLAQSNQTAKDYYVHYAYCPKCQKKFRRNYQIFFAKV